MISKKSLQRFKEIYQKEYQIEISDDETLKKAVQLLELYRAVYGEISGDYKNNLENKYEK